MVLRDDAASGLGTCGLILAFKKSYLVLLNNPYQVNSDSLVTASEFWVRLQAKVVFYRKKNY
jgi:hypothetical protein